MKRVLHHNLEITHRQVLEIQGVCLSVAPNPSSEGHISLWTLQEDRYIPTEKEFFLIPTGHPMPPGHVNYVGTVIDPEESGLVWHVFERDLA